MRPARQPLEQFRKAISSLSIILPMSSSTATSQDTATSLGWLAAICRSTSLAAKSAGLSTRPGWGSLQCLLRSLVPGWSAMRLANRYCVSARATSAIRSLDLTAARPLAGSHLRELDEAIGAYNALIASLHWFETYAPRRLVKQLMAQGEQATALVEREVTVLFTDIVDFTGLAERLSASDAATFLNDHFRLLAACVEAEGGTIDKYIGDLLMAFWGVRRSSHAPTSPTDPMTTRRCAKPYSWRWTMRSCFSSDMATPARRRKPPCLPDPSRVCRDAQGRPRY